MFNYTLFQIRGGAGAVAFCVAKRSAQRSLIFNSVSCTKQEYKVGGK
jgi:hypothetical protein